MNKSLMVKISSSPGVPTNSEKATDVLSQWLFSFSGFTKSRDF